MLLETIPSHGNSKVVKICNLDNFLTNTLKPIARIDFGGCGTPNTQGNCATEGNSGNCQSGNCHSGERWMRKPSVHGGK